ncbi:MAG: type IV pilus secretin PilQ, partial [Bdellovibrio sp.]
NLSVGTLDFFGTLQAALALAETEEQIKIISSPRIMTMSNETANINQTTEVAVRQVTQNGTATQESFQFKPLTMKLEVTPQVTADGSVIMKVLVNRQFQGADVSGAGTGAFSVNSREANTRVLVKNGQTSVIGGVYQSDATDGETGTPGLRDIPILGYLFKTKNINKSKSELLIFLTPRIIGQASSESSPATQDL